MLQNPSALLTPKFAATVAEAVLGEAEKMDKKDMVEALNKCQSMAAKARLLEGKGMNKSDSGLDVARKFLAGTLDDDLQPTDTEDDDEGEEQQPGVVPEAAGPEAV